MISQSKILSLSQQLQTTELNIRREYVQHIFLKYFYQQKGAESYLFKGGTALRIAFNSPRFSEDLDFSSDNVSINIIENLVLNTLHVIEKEGIKTSIIESKSTSGGYLANLEFEISQYAVNILIQVSLRKHKLINEVILINNDFTVPYTIFLLDRDILIAEKVQALLTRSKPRDFYDLYFLIRANLINSGQKNQLSNVNNKLDTIQIDFESELKQYLPKSYWPIIRDFKTNLKREITRFI